MVGHLTSRFMQPLARPLENQIASKIAQTFSDVSTVKTAQGMGNDAIKLFQGLSAPQGNRPDGPSPTREFGMKMLQGFGSAAVSGVVGRGLAMPFSGVGAQTVSNFGGTVTGMFIDKGLADYNKS